MRPLHRLVLKVVASVGQLFCLVHPGRAASNDDPFSLPVSQTVAAGASAQSQESGTEPSVVYATMVINHVKLKRFVKLRSVAGNLSIATDSAEYANLIAQRPAADYIFLREIPGITFSFDGLTNQLDVVKRRHSDGPNLIRLGGRPTSGAGRASPQTSITALLLDYDITASGTSSQLNAGGSFGSRLVRGNIAVESGWLFAQGSRKRKFAFSRLETAATIILPRSMTRISMGDVVSDTAMGNRAVRMGGLQLSTDFALRPDLITYPLPNFTGSVAIPTGIDLLVNHQLISQETVEPGEFTVCGIPVPTGRNGIGVEFRDALGRQQLRTVRFYSSRALLRPGLTQASVSIGAIRLDFAGEHDGYRDLALSAFARRGISSGVTAEFSIEASSGFSNVGGSGSFTLGSVGLLTGGVQFSRFVRPSNSARRGSLLSAAFESSGPFFAIQIEATKASDGYDDLASTHGDLPPPSTYAANLNFDLHRFGSLSFTAIERIRQHDERSMIEGRRTRVASASYRITLRKRLNLFADLSQRSTSNNVRSTSIVVGLSIQLNERMNVQASLYHQGAQSVADFGVFRPDREAGDVGFSARASKGGIDQLRAGVSYRGDWGRIEGEAGSVGGRPAARASAEGSLILADGSLFAHEKRSGSMVMVDARGIPDIEIERENRRAGVTKRSGKLLITEVVPLVPTKISIVSKSLPSDVSAANMEELISAPPRSVVKLRLAVERYVPLKLQLRGADGRFVTAGSLIRALPSKAQYIVGLDGALEINRVIEDRKLVFLTLDREEICYEMPASVGPALMPSIDCSMSKIIKVGELGRARATRQRLLFSGRFGY